MAVFESHRISSAKLTVENRVPIALGGAHKTQIMARNCELAAVLFEFEWLFPR